MFFLWKCIFLFCTTDRYLIISTLTYPILFIFWIDLDKRYPFILIDLRIFGCFSFYTGRFITNHLTRITKRGRKKLRALLFRVCMVLVAKNSAFKALHTYYTQRPDNPLKKMQSIIALCNKLIRILFAIGKKQFEFQEERMLKDITHMTGYQKAEVFA